MIMCELCHEDADAARWRLGMRLCEECADGVDYYASLTPAELKAEEEAQARYADEARG